MRFIAIRSIISLISSLCILSSRRREEKRKEKRITGCELPSITSPEDDGFDTTPKPPSPLPPPPALLLVITVRRFTAGRLFYSKIHVDGRIRGHSNTEFPREQNGTNIPSRNLLGVAAPRGRFIARVNSPGWETPDVTDRKPTPYHPLASQCRARQVRLIACLINT